jgi:hypothetical protein
MPDVNWGSAGWISEELHNQYEYNHTEQQHSNLQPSGGIEIYQTSIDDCQKQHRGQYDAKSFPVYQLKNSS